MLKKTLSMVTMAAVLGSSLYGLSEIQNEERSYVHVDKNTAKVTSIDKNQTPLNDNDVIFVKKYGFQRFKKEDIKYCVDKPVQVRGGWECSTIKGPGDWDSYVHVDKESKKLIAVTYRAEPLSNNDEVLILNENGLYPLFFALKYNQLKDSTKKTDDGCYIKDDGLSCACYTKKETEACKSIFTKTDIMSTGLSNIMTPIFTFGTSLATVGAISHVSLDHTELRKFYEDNNLSKYYERFDYSNLELYNKVLENNKKIGDAEIAKYKYAKEDAMIEKYEKEALQSRAKFDELFGKVEYTKTDGFGDTVKKQTCKIFTLQTKEEVARFYQETWKNPKFFDMNGYFYSSINREAQVAAAVFGAINTVVGKDFSMEDLSLQKEGVKMSGKLSHNAIVLSLAQFCLNTGEELKYGEYKLTLKQKHVQLLQAYIAANNLSHVDGSGTDACRYWPATSSKVLGHIVGAFSKFSRDKAMVKLLFILSSENTEDEKIQILLRQPNVKEMFEIISK